jgi:lysophospholipase L1-like esterase
MLKYVSVSRYIIASLMLSCILLLVCVLVALVKPKAIGGQPQHYLALGDSLAYGYQPNGDHTHGYVDDFFTFLQSRGMQDHQNLGCPGETSTTFISGGKCHYPLPFSSQLAAALAYLQQQAHAGQMTLITLNLGANDLLGEINPKTCKVSDTFTGDLQTLDTNLTKTILPQLRAAMKDNHGQIFGKLILLNYYDPYQNICPQTVQNIEILNNHLSHDVVGFGILANIFGAFGGAVVPNTNICKYTWMCSPAHGPDIHPTTAGYQVMTNVLEKMGLTTATEKIEPTDTISFVVQHFWKSM